MNEYLSGCLLFPLFVLNVNKEKKKTTHTDEGTSTEYPKSTPCYRTEGQICDTQQSERRQKDMLPPSEAIAMCVCEAPQQSPWEPQLLA